MPSGRQGWANKLVVTQKSKRARIIARLFMVRRIWCSTVHKGLITGLKYTKKWSESQVIWLIFLYGGGEWCFLGTLLRFASADKPFFALVDWLWFLLFTLNVWMFNCFSFYSLMSFFLIKRTNPGRPEQGLKFFLCFSHPHPETSGPRNPSPVTILSSD